MLFLINREQNKSPRFAQSRCMFCDALQPFSPIICSPSFCKSCTSSRVPHRSQVATIFAGVTRLPTPAFLQLLHRLHAFPRLVPVVPVIIPVTCFPTCQLGVFSTVFCPLVPVVLVVAPITSFPALGNGYTFFRLFSLPWYRLYWFGCTGHMFSRAWYRLHVFPRFAVDARFSVLFTIHLSIFRRSRQQDYQPVIMQDVRERGNIIWHLCVMILI